MFTVRTIHLAEGKTETAAYDLAFKEGNPAAPEALWAEFIESRPPVFKEKLPFLSDVDLEWSAAPGGVVLASTSSGADPCSMAILLPGKDSEADQLMWEAWRRNVLTPLMGEPEAARVDAAERPLLVNVLCPGAGARASALRLTALALASAYLRSLGAG